MIPKERNEEFRYSVNPTKSMYKNVAGINHKMKQTTKNKKIKYLKESKHATELNKTRNFTDTSQQTEKI